jgi:hypothetical protein
MLALTLDAAQELGLLQEAETMWLDRGYDSDLTLACLAERGITDTVIARMRKRGEAQPKRNVAMVCAGRWNPPTPGFPTKRPRDPRERFPGDGWCRRRDGPKLRLAGPAVVRVGGPVKAPPSV